MLCSLDTREDFEAHVKDLASKLKVPKWVWQIRMHTYLQNCCLQSLYMKFLTISIIQASKTACYLSVLLIISGFVWLWDGTWRMALNSTTPSNLIIFGCFSLDEECSIWCFSLDEECSIWFLRTFPVMQCLSFHRLFIVLITCAGHYGHLRSSNGLPHLLLLGLSMLTPSTACLWCL
jgi:hypothetical protein